MIEAMTPKRSLVSLYSGLDMENYNFDNGIPPRVHNIVILILVKKEKNVDSLYDR